VARVVLYTGKGGVGKTTTAAATAAVAAERGRRTLVASADAAHSLGDVLDVRLGAEPLPVAPGLDALEIDARREAERHWGAIRGYLVSLFRSQGIEDVVAEELALLPGADELATLLAVEGCAAHGGYELVVVDCAPTDAALRLLTLPEVARGALRWLLRVQRAAAGVVTPLARGLVAVPLPDAAVFRDAEALLYRRLHALRGLVTGPGATTRLVATPERMVIDEALRAWTDLCLFGIPCDAVVLNRLLPDAAAAEPFFRDWARVQAERRAEVAGLFAPLPVLEGPLQDDEVVGLERLRAHGRTLFAAAEPDAVLCRAPGVRFRAEGGGVVARIPLPGARAADLDVAKLDDQLVVRSAGRRRALPLPRRAAHLALASARLERGELCVRLVPPDAGA
jgi:arsenite-transporting ATPase